MLRLLIPPAAFALGAAAVTLPGGCGSAAPSPPTTARGVVRFQGRPLAGGLVVFAPDPDRGTTGRPARGPVGPDGAFQLQIDAAADVPPGWYRVAIAGPPSGMSERGFAPFPPALRRPDRSGLLREVRAGQENSFEFLIDVPAGP